MSGVGTNAPAYGGARAYRYLLASVCLFPCVTFDTAAAQSAAEVRTLPPVTVEQPAPRVRQARQGRRTDAVARAGRRRAAAATQTAAQPGAAPSSSVFERGTDPVRGFVPNVSSAAMKSDTPILETPQSVSVVSRDQLDARGVTTLVESLQYVAGVTIQPGGKDPRYDNVSIRGFDAFGVGAYRDGLREVGDLFSIFRTEPYGIERIDVIKGPSSVMYGQGSPGGLVDSISKRPTDKAFGEVVGLFGNYDRYQGAFDVGGPATKDGSLLYRVTGVFRDADASIAHFSNDVKDNRTYIAPAVTWKPTNDTTLTILSEYDKDVTGNAFPVSLFHGRVPTALKALPLFLGDPSYNTFQQEQGRIGYLFEHRFSNDFIVESKARYGHIDLEYRYLTYSPTVVPLDTLTNFARVARRIAEQGDSFSTDNHVIAKVSTGDLQHTVVSGIDYLLLDLHSRRYTGAAPDINTLNPIYGQAITVPTTLFNGSADERISQAGFYLQDQIKLQNWIFTLGGRYDIADQNTLSLGTGSLPVDQRTVTQDRAFTKRGAVAYEFNGGLVPYYSYSESFLPTPGTAFNGSPFKPTTAQQHEIGVKFQPSRRLLATVAAFDLTRQNSLTPDPVNGSTFSVQTGEVNSRGVEFELLAELVPGLNAVATFTSQDVKVTQSTTAAEIGKVPTLVPANMASAYLDYTFQTGPLADWGFGGGLRYNGETFGNNTNTLVNADYVVFDAGIHYRQPKGVNLALNVKNIADRVTTACTISGGCQYTSPRTVVGTLSYRW